MKKRGELCNADGTPGVRLVYIDPPFAVKKDFKGTQGEKAYQDKIIGAEFIEHVRKRLIFLRELMSDDGSIYVHLDQKKGHYIKLVMDEVFGESNFLGEIAWHYPSMSNKSTFFPAKHDCIYAYTKSQTWLFDPTNIFARVPYKESTIKRSTSPAGFNNEKANYLKSETKLSDTVWSIPHVKSKKELVGYPTQKPEQLLAKIISSSSRPGDLVLDCFSGSGTTLAVAEKLGRRWIGIDCGKLAIYTTQKRLLTIDKSKSLDDPKKTYRQGPEPFSLLNAGLYDLKKLLALDFDRYREFVLHLFQCTDDPHEIRKVQFDGYLQNDHVMVYDFNKYPDAIIEYEYLEKLHRQLGKTAGKRVFIIAPALQVRFLESYVDIDETRYMPLVVPVSLLDDLYQKRFSKLQQPSDLDSINQVLDAVGFTFVQVPSITCSYQRHQVESTPSENDSCVVHINSFRSQIMSKKKVDQENLETLAMVMVDFDYDGRVFDLDRTYYPEEMIRISKEDPSQGLSFEFPVALATTGQIMITYLDIYGNEKLEVKELTDFTEVTT